MKKIFPYLILVVLIVAAVYLWQKQPETISSPEQNSASQTLLVKFMFAEDQITTVDYPFDDNVPASVFDITKNIAEQKNWSFDFTDYQEMGLFINQIDTKIGGDDNSYWLYYVNGEQPQIAVEKYFPVAGDELEWKFEPSTY